MALNDTICALSTPPGTGALAVLRLSGPEAVAIAMVLAPKLEGMIEARHAYFVQLSDSEGPVDEGVLTVFMGPQSYTGEDVVELSVHGSPYVQQRLLQAMLAEGARMALPGEFTQRAFMNRKLDLSQAEAVADLIASQSAAQHTLALNQLRGGFGRRIEELRQQLIDFSALIELELDFSEEDVQFAKRVELTALIDRLTDLCTELIDSFRYGNAVRQGIPVAIVGAPNSGKSTLLNALLQEDRAIVSEIAGTTRDTIEEVINIDGILFRLIDTAGIRESEDAIEVIGVERSREKMREADIVVYMFDAETESRGDLEATVAMLREVNGNHLLVGNKADISGDEAAARKFGGMDALYISAKSGHHVDVLKERLVDKVLQGKVNPESTIVTNARHYASLQQVSSSLKDLRAGMDNKVPGDLLALDIRRALHFLGEITGEITNEDQLDYIFSKFCIGK